MAGHHRWVLLLVLIISSTITGATDVIIIGAGLSGLAAALELESYKHSSRSSRSSGSRSNSSQHHNHHNNNVSITILESRHVIGGRVSTCPITNIDMGGTYIHGSSLNNSLWWLIQEKFPEIQTIPTGGNSAHPGGATATWRYYCCANNNNNNNDNKTITTNTIITETATTTSLATTPPEERTKILGLVEREKAQSLIQAWYQAFQSILKDANYNISQNTTTTERVLREMAENVTRSLRTRTATPNSSSFISSALDEALLEFELRAAFEHDRGIPLYKHDVAGFANDWDWVEYPGNDHILLEGMWDLVWKMASRIQGNIHLNTRVERIHYGENFCRVTSSDGRIWKAHACIVAIPLGVLKQTHHRMFDPPLPLPKKEALARTGLAVYNTAVIRWKHNLCSNGTQYLIGGDSTNPFANGFVCPNEWKKKNLTDFTQFYIEGDYFHSSEENYSNLLLWKDQAVKIMREIYPSLSLTIDDIVDISVSKWHLDGNFLGSYSSPTTTTRGNFDRMILAETVGNALYFAGEHTNTNGRYQSLDGAYDTGTRTASQVARDYGFVLKGDNSYRNPHKSSSAEPRHTATCPTNGRVT